MIELFRTILYIPLLNALVFLYETVALQDLGIAIILMTLAIRIILYPLFGKAVRHNLALQRIQPKVKKLQDEHKHDRVKQGEELMRLYKTEGVNPFAGFFILLIQLPILIALFQLSINIVKPDALASLYSFIPSPDGPLNTVFLGLINLSEPDIFMVVLAAVAQFVQGKLSLARAPQKTKDLSPMEQVGRQMVYVAPVMTLVLFANFPAAIGLYWLTTTLASIVQQWLINREFPPSEHDRNIHPNTS